MASAINEFIRMCDELSIVSESNDNVKLSNKVFAFLKNMIIKCKHLIIQASYQIKRLRRFKVPKEIKSMIEKLSLQCTNIYTHIMSDDFDVTKCKSEIDDIRNLKEYTTLFSKGQRTYSNNEIVDVDTRKVITNLQSVDKTLKGFEIELNNLTHLRKSKYSYDELSCLIILFSEYTKIQVQFLKWNHAKLSEDTIDIGKDISITLDDPIF